MRLAVGDGAAPAASDQVATAIITAPAAKTAFLIALPPQVESALDP
jgi:hypothetical protein